LATVVLFLLAQDNKKDRGNQHAAGETQIASSEKATVETMEH
jgi:hypothetical protein